MVRMSVTQVVRFKPIEVQAPHSACSKPSFSPSFKFDDTETRRRQERRDAANARWIRWTSCTATLANTWQRTFGAGQRSPQVRPTKIWGDIDGGSDMAMPGQVHDSPQAPPWYGGLHLWDMVISFAQPIREQPRPMRPPGTKPKMPPPERRVRFSDDRLSPGEAAAFDATMHG